MPLRLAGFALCLAAAFPAAAEQANVSISRQDCARLVRHAASADVAYRPGVDARGRKVAPADLPGSGGGQNFLPEVFEFNIPVNPVTWAAAKKLNAQKAATNSSIVNTDTAKTAAQTQVTSLTATRNTLTTNAATLAAELGVLNATLTPLQAQVTADTRASGNREYLAAVAAVAAKQKEIDANTAALASVTSRLAAQQAIVDAAPSTDASLRMKQTETEGKLAALSAKGYDDASFNVAAIRYNPSTGQFTLNGQPIGSPEEQAIAEACAKRGVK